MWIDPMGRTLLMAALGALALQGGMASAVQEPSWPEAVGVGRRAAEAVLGRTGDETCLQGKLMNAMVSVYDSCEATERREPLCTLAEDFIVGGVVPLSEMDVVSKRFLKLSAP